MRRLAATLVLLVVAVAVPALADEACEETLARAIALHKSFHEGPGIADQAIAAYEQAAKDEACAFEASWRLSDLYLCLGTIDKSEERQIALFAKGREAAKRAIELEPGRPEGHYHFAVNLGSHIEIDGVFKNLFKVRTLSKAVQKALDLDPDYAPALVVRARFVYDLPSIGKGSKQESERMFRRALEAAPSFETAHLEYARFLIKEGRPAEAEKLLERLFADDFEHAYPSAWETIEKPRAMRLLHEARHPSE